MKARTFLIKGSELLRLNKVTVNEFCEASIELFNYVCILITLNFCVDLCNIYIIRQSNII